MRTRRIGQGEEDIGQRGDRGLGRDGAGAVRVAGDGHEVIRGAGDQAGHDVVGGDDVLPVRIRPAAGGAIQQHVVGRRGDGLPAQGGLVGAGGGGQVGGRRRFDEVDGVQHGAHVVVHHQVQVGGGGVPDQIAVVAHRFHGVGGIRGDGIQRGAGGADGQMPDAVDQIVLIKVVVSGQDHLDPARLENGGRHVLHVGVRAVAARGVGVGRFVEHRDFPGLEAVGHVLRGPGPLGRAADVVRVVVDRDHVDVAAIEAVVAVGAGRVRSLREGPHAGAGAPEVVVAGAEIGGQRRFQRQLARHDPLVGPFGVGVGDGIVAAGQVEQRRRGRVVRVQDPAGNLAMHAGFGTVAIIRGPGKAERRSRIHERAEGIIGRRRRLPGQLVVVQRIGLESGQFDPMDVGRRAGAGHDRGQRGGAAAVGRGRAEIDGHGAGGVRGAFHQHVDVGGGGALQHGAAHDGGLRRRQSQQPTGGQRGVEIPQRDSLRLVHASPRPLPDSRSRPG